MRKKGPTPIPAYERVMRKCVTSIINAWDGSPCLEWTGGCSGDGYGNIRVGSRYEGNAKLYSTHRVAYEHHYGTVPDGLYVCHHCDNPVCCNHLHLFAGTAKDNVKDMHNKGRDGVCKLSAEDVRCIRRAIELGFPQLSIAKVYGVRQSAISRIATGKCWRHIA